MFLIFVKQSVVCNVSIHSISVYPPFTVTDFPICPAMMAALFRMVLKVSITTERDSIASSLFKRHPAQP